MCILFQKYKINLSFSDQWKQNNFLLSLNILRENFLIFHIKQRHIRLKRSVCRNDNHEQFEVKNVFADNGVCVNWWNKIAPGIGSDSEVVRQSFGDIHSC